MKMKLLKINSHTLQKLKGIVINHKKVSYGWNKMCEYMSASSLSIYSKENKANKSVLPEKANYTAAQWLFIILYKF